MNFQQNLEKINFLGIFFQDSELFFDARIGRHLLGRIRSWSMLEEGGSIYHLVLADLNGCGQQLRSRTFLFVFFLGSGNHTV